jgi:hypothetical protein
VQNVDDFDIGMGDSINHNVIGMGDDFAGTWNAAALVKIRVLYHRDHGALYILF